MSEDLKPCPFCGTEIKKYNYESGFGGRWFWYPCPHCHAQGPCSFSNVPSELYAKWNTRAPVAEQSAQVHKDEPVAWMDDNGEVVSKNLGERADVGKYFYIPLFTRPQPSTQQDEPVAYRYKSDDQINKPGWRYSQGKPRYDLVQPLFTTPQPAPLRTLTDEEIHEVWLKLGIAYSKYEFARAILAAAQSKK